MFIGSSRKVNSAVTQITVEELSDSRNALFGSGRADAPSGQTLKGQPPLAHNKAQRLKGLYRGQRTSGLLRPGHQMVPGQR
jgi:hypothetical protein